MTKRYRRETRPVSDLNGYRAIVCLECGVDVGNTDIHDKWHENQSSVARSARSADKFTRKLG